jgi:signal transduction histidine kinase
MVSISASQPSRVVQSPAAIAGPDGWQEMSQRLFYLLSIHQEPEPLLVDMAATLNRLLPQDAQVMILARSGPVVLAAGAQSPGSFQHLLSWDWTERLSEQLIATPLVLTNLETIVSGGALETLLTAWNAIAPDPDHLPQSILAVPTQFQGGVNGLLSVVTTQPHAWTDAEVAGLTVAARPVEIALSQLSFRYRIQQQERYQAIVNQLTLALRQASDLGDIMRLATEGTAQALQVPRGMLLRLKYEDPRFKQRPLEGPPQVRVSLDYEWDYDPDMTDAEIPQPHGATSAAARRHPTFWLADCALCNQAFTQPTQPLIVRDQSQVSDRVAAVFNIPLFPAVIMAPLESQGMVLGFLVFQRQYPSYWSPEDIELVQLVAAQVSAALIQTETLRQVQALVEQRTAELQQSLAVQAKLYDRTRQQIDQLRRLNQVKDEFLASVSHELRTPLTSMTMAIRMLRQTSLSSQALPADQRDRATRYLDILEQQCAQEVNLVNDLLRLQELESQKMHLQVQEINVVAMAKDMAIAFDEKWSVKGLTLHLHLPTQPLRLQTDSSSLNRILLELLTNAGKYAAAHSTVHCHMHHQPETSPSQVVIGLRNLGPSIAAADLPHIFDKFRRTQAAHNNAVPGTGLGLALVKSLVQHLNGAIAVSSDPVVDSPLYETCFTLILPQVLEMSR